MALGFRALGLLGFWACRFWGSWPRDPRVEGRGV